MTESELLMAIGKQLKTLREEKFFAQSAIASAIGYSQSAVCRWENGWDPIPLAALLSICKFYGVTLGEFFKEAGL